MPKALIPVTASNVSVTRRVSMNVVQYLTDMMGLPESTKIYLPGNTQAVPLNNAEFGICCDPKLSYPGDGKLVVNFTEEAEEEHSLTTSVNDKMNRAIILNEKLMLDIRPVYRYVKLTASIEFTATSETQAQRWLDDMRAMFSAGRMENLLELEYYYQIPQGAVMVLKAIHDTLMKSAWPVQDAFEPWVIGMLVNGAYPKNLTTLGGFHDTLAIAEKQQDVLGWFDWTNTPDTPERNSDGSGTYTASLTYQIYYSRPTHLYADYPIIIHQRPIPRLYRQVEPYGHLHTGLRRVSVVKDAFDEMRFLEDNRGIVPYAQYPNFDDWAPVNVQGANSGSITIFTGLVMLGTDDQQTLFDLSQLGSCRFRPHFLEYFYAMQDRALDDLNSFFKFSLYRNNELIQGNLLEFVPGTLKVRSKKPLNPEYVYHIQIGIKRNWMFVGSEMRECISNWPTVAWLIARSLGILLGGAKSLEELKLNAPTYKRLNKAPCYGEGYLLPHSPPEGIDWGIRPEDVFIDTGYISKKVIEEAALKSDDICDNVINHITIGPTTVMYADILTFRK